MDKQVRKNYIRKGIPDLGEAAFIRMKGFKCVGRKARSFYFDVEPTDESKFDDLNLDYINSPQHDFDACIMSLKKVVERIRADETVRFVSDLGAAAYVKMHGFRCAGRQSRNFYFEVAEEDGNKFNQLCIEYLGSSFHDFDSAIMALKKLPEYLQGD